MDHVISVGGGLTSTLFLPRLIVERYGRDNTKMVMARLPNEDPDVWKLCDAVERHLGVPIEYIGLNKTPWDIFREEGIIGNTRIDPCSRRLKREVLAEHMRQNYDPADTMLHVGITANEIDRMVEIKGNWTKKGWLVDAPLAAPGAFTLTRKQQMAECERLFGFVPRLYKWSFNHNNCGGACVKAGQREWARLLWYIPDVYAWWEESEGELSPQIGGYTILRDRRGGSTKPLTLTDFRHQCERWWQGYQPDTLFERLPRTRGMQSTPACAWCSAA